MIRMKVFRICFGCIDCKIIYIENWEIQWNIDVNSNREIVKFGERNLSQVGNIKWEGTKGFLLYVVLKPDFDQLTYRAILLSF